MSEKLWLPPQRPQVPPKQPVKRPRLITYWYDQTDEFKRLCDEHGAIYIATVKVPCFNQWGQQGGEEFATIYMHHEDIDMGILC